jgi:DASS family divalent anion:Na+ symporter
MTHPSHPYPEGITPQPPEPDPDDPHLISSPGGALAEFDTPPLAPWLSWLILVLLGLLIWSVDVVLGMRPEGVEPWGWRLFSVFVPTILGLMLRPLPGGAVVLLALMVTLLIAALPPFPAADALPEGTPGLHFATKKAWPYTQALGGYINSSVWLVLAAYFMSRGLIKTGLARRIALTFVRLLGRNSLGLSYALVASDTLLAGLIPSNAARVGGVLLPITRSLAELYRSYPGRSAALLGTTLMLTLYQGDVVACALFLTGQASNPLARDQAAQLTQGVAQVNYATWFLYASVPALVSLLVVPWLVYRLTRPKITRTPEATKMARDQLRAQGPPRLGECIMMGVFAGVCLSWVVLGYLFAGKYTTLIALMGSGVLFLSGVLTWEDAITERGAWDVFIWYGGLVQMGTLLNDAGVIKVFAQWVAANLGFLPLALLFVVMLVIYFYAHYGFASITAHILSMYPAFVGVLLALGAPPWLTALGFAYFANLCAGLTHYGTTPAPIIFGVGYVSHGWWWRIGFLMSVVNVTIWLAVGLPWWKFWGLW